MPTVYDLSLEQLTDRVIGWGEPAFRAKQVWSQLWKRAATYDQMSDVSPVLREQLAAELPLGVEVLEERTADRGATRKALLRLGGEHAIETVLMGYRDRVTVCVSSQSGCAMGCTLRDRADGPSQQPDGGRDRSAGSVGTSGSPSLAGQHPAASLERRVYGHGRAERWVSTSQRSSKPQ